MPISVSLRAVMDAVLRVPEKELPAWKVVDLGPEGAALVKINKVLPTTMSPEESQETYRQFGSYWGKAEVEAYGRALKRQYKLTYTAKAPATKASAAEKSSAEK